MCCYYIYFCFWFQNVSLIFLPFFDHNMNCSWKWVILGIETRSCYLVLDPSLRKSLFIECNKIKIDVCLMIQFIVMNGKWRKTTKHDVLQLSLFKSINQFLFEHLWNNIAFKIHLWLFKSTSILFQNFQFSLLFIVEKLE